MACEDAAESDLADRVADCRATLDREAAELAAERRRLSRAQHVPIVVVLPANPTP